MKAPHPGDMMPVSVHMETMAAAMAASTAFPPCMATVVPASAAIRVPAAMVRVVIVQFLDTSGDYHYTGFTNPAYPGDGFIAQLHLQKK